MFQIRVQTKAQPNDVAAADNVDATVDEELQDAAFLTGNPRVRVSTGKLRFYRPNQPLPGRQATGADGLPKERNMLLCIVTVPAHMTPLELLEFSASFRADIELVRILKDPERSNCMALMQFTSQERADQFFQAFNGTYFNSIEQERCKIVFVRSIEFDVMEDEESKESEDGELEHKCAPSDKTTLTQQQQNSLFPQPPAGMTEIPTCAVCLDRLDASASGILTTLCNHTFHCDCLFRWEGSSCPVCRYSHGDIGSSCEVCHTTEHLWICLICGHVGCGRYSNEHAKQHYQETLHTYSLELETQRVWDYAGDGYVHRLILNKQDGKFVEFPSPNTVSGERSQMPPPTSAEEEEVEHRKLEKLAVEYNFLLKSQLEEQRLFYERRLARDGSAQALEQEKKNIRKANEELAARNRKLEEELSFVRELNKSLIENQKQWKERVRSLEEQNARIEKETAIRVGDLEAQVRDLMFYLDTQSKVERSVHKHDIQVDGYLGGSIEIETKPAAPKQPTSTRRGGRHKNPVAEKAAAASHAKPPVRILGLDINTASTGYTVLDEAGRVRTWGTISTTEHSSSDVLSIARSLGAALADVRDQGEAQHADVVWKVGIEDFMRTYSFGKFHSKGLFQLAQLNGIASFVFWQEFPPIQPVHLHPSLARGYFDIVATTQKGSKTVKERVLEFAMAREPVAMESWPRMPRAQRWSDATYDIVDSYVIAAYRWHQHLVECMQADSELEAAFADQYMTMLLSGKTKSKQTMEETVVGAMDAKARHAYLRQLFHEAVSEWVKLHQFPTERGICKAEEDGAYKDGH
ncbi:TPA: hypothetical protein N0F65_010988 [Lagenidium giganteum]|uniref:BRCA1-associated protein n=1 Tax=Lagenidium giganteum TaxID=4803 RepID=A0AAV2Z581_9STRA|nr:TPA: hypothetical protein N0F65_010988 [Lagenidium giganteum]